MDATYILLKSQLGLDSLVIAASGYVIVFIALVLLFWFFSLVPRVLSLRRRRNGNGPGNGLNTDPTGKETMTGETTAAIAMALYLYMEEIHDRESGVLTIKRISKAYSPWSSKIYAVRNQFNRL